MSTHTSLTATTERRFAIVLENDTSVIRWMRPSAKQFNLYYGAGGVNRYEPDFVVETADVIYMVETKASNEINSNPVKEKAEAGRAYCAAASEWNGNHGGKPWEYMLVSHDEVHLQSSFKYLFENRVPMQQMTLL